MKTYIGERLDRPDTSGDTRVRVWDEDHEQGYPLRHHVRHSPDGFNWGYSGSGPAELARCILIDFLGRDNVSSALYQEFKARYIAGLAQDRGWDIPETQIVAFLRGPAAQAINRWLDEEDAPPDVDGVAGLDRWYEDQDRINHDLKASYGTVQTRRE